MTDDMNLHDLLAKDNFNNHLTPERVARLIIGGQMSLDFCDYEDFEDQVRSVCQMSELHGVTNENLQAWWLKYRGDRFEMIPPTHDVWTNAELSQDSKSVWRRHHSA